MVLGRRLWVGMVRRLEARRGEAEVRVLGDLGGVRIELAACGRRNGEPCGLQDSGFGLVWARLDWRVEQEEGHDGG